MRSKLDHIGVAVRSIDGALGLYRDVLGLTPGQIETVAEQGVNVARLAVGESHVELLEPLGPQTPVGRFIESRGEGVHHICVAVSDLAAAMESVRAAGLRLIDDKPRTGAGGRLIAFIHPKSTGGVLIELSQEGDPRDDC